MDDEKLCMISIGIVIVMVIVLAGWTYVDENGWPWENEVEDEEVLLIQEGDEVSIDYIGRFLGSDGGKGPVFDTTLPEVARNDSIPKSISFQEKRTYDDLTFTVGSGDMIEGFDKSIRGKKEGDTYQVAIPPQEGYGEAYEERTYTLNSTQVLPLKETLTKSDFHIRLPQVDLENSESFIHPFWRWNVEIIEWDIEEVTILHQPVFGEDYPGFPWNTTVVDISTERNVITLHHRTSEIDKGLPVPFDVLRVYDPSWARNATDANPEDPPMEGFVTSARGQITIDFNREVQGKTLYFQITVNKVTRS
ncbi:MAG: FKBP-type peptidyl-prolyl cis-trans isomerase [Thermoplasmatota archaeon]